MTYNRKHFHLLLGFILLLFIILAFFFIRFRSRTDSDIISVSALLANQAPSTDSVSVSAGQALNLTEYATTSLTVSGSYTDNNGCTDVSSQGSIEAVLYRSGVSASNGCTPNDLNCYKQTCTASCDGGTAVSSTYSCSFNIQYFADATDAGAYSDQNWVAHVTSTDGSGAQGAASTTFEVNTLTALSVGALISYGTLALGSTSLEQSVTLTNTGNNNAANVQVYGDSMTCTVGSFGVGQQRYSSASGDGWAGATALSASSTSVYTTGASGAWYSTSWSTRRPVTVTNNVASILADFQVQVTTTYSNSMNSDFSDIRFTDSDATTSLSFWMETSTVSADATFWVKVPSLPASGSSTIYMYYGNATATAASNIDNTMLFGDDFSGALDTNKWTFQSSPTTSAGLLSLVSNTGIWATNYALPDNVVMEAYVQKLTESAYPLDGRVGAYNSASKFQLGTYDGSTGIEILYEWYGANYEYYLAANGGARTFGTFAAAYTSDWHRDTLKYQAGNRVDYTSYGVTNALTSVIPSASTLHPEIYSYAEASGAMNADWILVRQLASSDPSFSIGAEQSYSSGTTTLFSIPKTTSSSSASTAPIYLYIKLPANGIRGDCTGTDYFIGS